MKRSRQAWAFIDTNIYLDFYRSNNDARLQLLQKIEEVADRILSTYQVRMEFLKHRQNELLRTISGLKIPDMHVPAVVSDGAVLSSSQKIRDYAEKRDGYLKKRVERMLSQPKTHDKVCQVFESIFSSDAAHVLTRDMPVRRHIKRLALRRFLLGYPPRKKNDTSIGDALNWEWIIHCASEFKGIFYIVSRDSDFGAEFGRQLYLNDHLKFEFRERVGNKSIRLTNKLSDVLKALEVKVTKEELAAEEEMISAARSEKDEATRPTALKEILSALGGHVEK